MTQCVILLGLWFFVLLSPGFYVIFFKIVLIYPQETQRETETQAEREADSLWGARCGTRSQDPGITT